MTAYLVGVVLLCVFCGLLVTAAIWLLVDSLKRKAEIYRRRASEPWDGSGD